VDHRLRRQPEKGRTRRPLALLKQALPSTWCPGLAGAPVPYRRYRITAGCSSVKELPTPGPDACVWTGAGTAGSESVLRSAFCLEQVQAECKVRADPVGSTADTMSCRIAPVAGFGLSHRLRRKSEQSRMALAFLRQNSSVPLVSREPARTAPCGGLAPRAGRHRPGCIRVARGPIRYRPDGTDDRLSPTGRQPTVQALEA